VSILLLSFCFYLLSCNMFWLLLLILPYSAILLIATINLWKKNSHRSKESASDKDLPPISVIIAAKNEESNLNALISDLQSLDYPKEKLEIIIVDDHSTDATARLIKEAEGINYLLSDGNGKKKALAIGLKQSSGELILTTDADCKVQTEWLRAYAEKYLEEKPDFIIGQVKPDHQKSLLSSFSEIEFYSLQAVTAGLALAGKAVLCNGANLAFRKEAISNYSKSVKSDIASGDDIFLLHSVKRNKGKIAWLNNTQATVTTRLPGRIKDFFRQRSRWTGKSVYYKDFDTIFVGLSTLIANISIIAALVFLIINIDTWPLFVAFSLARILTEIMLLSSYLKKPEKLRLLLLHIPLSLLYPIYTILIATISFFPRKRW